MRAAFLFYGLVIVEFLKVNGMKIEINEQEGDLLLEVLRTAHTSLVEEIVHTDGFEYKEMLKQKLERLKALESTVEAAHSTGKTV